jgi:UDP-N-acetylmuramoyl-L-alanyl-D-glutamate--2,6-diaminopimelate ligase
VTLAVVSEFLHKHPQLKVMHLDSRQVQPGDLFIAMPGATTDGRQYVQQAVAQGAAAIIAEAIGWNADININVPLLLLENLKPQLAEIATYFYKDPSHNLRVIGVTGTNGKTSTSNYIAQLFDYVGIKCGLMGTLGNGMLDNLIPSPLTTSDCCTLQNQLFEFSQAQAKFVAMEVSSIGLCDDRLLHTQIDTAIFTNLSQDHLDYHHTMEDYFAAKCKLFTEYAPKHCVINLDDPYSKRLLDLIPRSSRIITYSLLNPAADLYYADGIIHTLWGTGPLVTKLIGKFNISNVMAALACCAIQGISIQTLLQAASKLNAVPGRMQAVPCVDLDAPRVVVDYAHTPDALIKALQTLQQYKQRHLICIIGCGGDRDRSKRPLMLRAVIENSDKVIITQDNPRTEDPQQIVRDMLAGHPLNTNIVIEMDRATAIKNAIAAASSEDLILIAGKGHEDYQIIGTTKLPFSDLLVAQQTLEARGEQAWTQ